MPADADLLCEYYLNAPNLSGKSTALVETNNAADASTLNNELSKLKESLEDSMDTLKTNKLTNHSHQLHQKSPIDLNWCKIRKTGIGLLNLGNNCYLNATLQCLAYTPPLSQWLVFRPHSPLCKFKQLKGFCALCEVEKIIYDIFNSCNGFAKPNSLCFNIKKISNVFGVGTQEDASEFFTTLLESMAKSIKFAVNLELKQQQHQTTFNKKTILDDIFSFQFRSRITCCNCGKLSDTYENTNTWPVDVKYVQDIRKGMLHFLREEVLDGENKYNCDKCNKKVRATKKYSLKTSPNILVVHLKRFDFTSAGKLTHFVTYPETLNLKSFMSDSVPNDANETLHFSDLNSSSSSRNTAYKLYGVLVHLGYTSHSGHYYSYVRGPNDVWYKADDQQISTVQSQDALGQNAYILFYNRIQSTPQTANHTKDYFHIPKSTPNLNDSFKPTNIPTSLITSPNDLDSANKQELVVLPKFKSTFIAVETTTTPSTTQTQVTTMSTSSSSTTKIETVNINSNNKQIDSDSNKENVNHQSSKSTTTLTNSTKTLNYDQVLRIKKLNKRKLKLFNKKKELAELKKTLNSPSTNDSTHTSTRKLKKQIRKLKKQIKKYKIKIKKLKRKNKKYLNNETNSSNESKVVTNSLSLLKQYNSSSSCSSSSSSSSPSSLESSPCSSPKSSRSSFSSVRSSSNSSVSSNDSNLRHNSKEILENANTKLEETQLKVKQNENVTKNSSSDSHMSSSSSSNKRFKYDDDSAKRPESDNNYTNNSKSNYSTTQTTAYSNKTKYFNTPPPKYYNCSSSSQQQYSWRNNYKYKYSSPYYQNPYYTNYNKNKSYHFSRY